MSRNYLSQDPKILAGLAIVMAVAVTAGCDNDDNDDDSSNGGSTTKSISFAPVKAPETDDEKRAVLSSATATVDGKDYAIGFNTILRSGEFYSASKAATLNTSPSAFGQLYDKLGMPLYATDGSPRLSVDNDFSSLLTGTDGKLYMVSHFESRPGAMYLTLLDQDKDTGALAAVRTRHLDFSAVEGGWVHCAGSVTPWGTHLGSEEYEPDASKRDPATGSIDDYYDAMGAYYGGNLLAMNPYSYGYQVEVKVDNFETADVAKHYSMGRVAHELGYVMPDQKTTYISDDGSYVGLFRFVADTAGDLSAGTLYAAKWTQTGTTNGGTATLTWIDLGHATDAEIKTAIDAGTTFADIFDRATPAADGTCPAGMTFSKHSYGEECLQVKTGMEKIASRLETRRYAGMLGATLEFEKMEGITHDPDNNTMYLAMSRVRGGMSDTKGDVQLPLNYCGAVYALPLDSSYVANSIAGEVVGIPRLIKHGAAADNPYAAPFEKNECDLDGIAEPDNVTFMPGYKTLIIGEDTGVGHQNDMIWAYNVESKTMTRIQTTPYGSETTSPYFYPNINGWGYLMSVIQHPFGESDTDQLVAGSGADRGYTGYIGPFPAMD
jgi:secreted PhoX family phosphatase